MNQDSEQALLKELDKFTVLGSIGVIVGLVVVYFVVSSIPWLPEPVRQLLLALVANLIPVLLVFVVSFWLFRRIQTIRSERQATVLAEQISDHLEGVIRNNTPILNLLTEKESPDNLDWHLLVQSAEDEGKLFLRDRFGLPRPINDERTAAYLMQILGYERTEVAKLPSADLQPTGPEVVSLADWEPPSTPEEERKIEARRAFKFLGKEVERTNEGTRILRFNVRNDAGASLYIRSATLVVHRGAPLSEVDVSPKNRPVKPGYLLCSLLFSNDEESETLVPGKPTVLRLHLQTQVSEEDVSSLTRREIGYIKIEGEYRGTPIEFMKHDV